MNETVQSPPQAEKGEGVLEKEYLLFKSSLPAWADRIGEHVLIKGDEVVGFFPTREEAVKAGFDRFGLVSFFVSQVVSKVRIYYIGNVLF